MVATLDQVQQVFALKTEMREAWYLLDLENRIKVALILVSHTKSTKAPQTAFYRKIFKNSVKEKLEPTYVSGYAPPTDMLGLVSMDQFRQRHPSPPCYMQKQDIARYLNWPHGPVANARPLLNFHTLWKVFSTILYNTSRNG